MNGPTEPADGGLYRDWDLLQRLHRDLQVLGARYGLLLEEPIDVRSQQRRAKQVEEVMRQNGQRRDPLPGSWQELAERLHADDWLARFVKSRSRYRAAPHDDTREVIVICVLEKLYFVIIRNAGTWHRNGDHAGDWKGYVIRQATQITQRLAKREGPEPGHGGWGDDGSGPPFENLPDRHEFSPEDQAALRELIDRLPDAERAAVRAWFFTDLSPQEIAQALAISEEELKRRLQRALDQLRRLLPGRRQRRPPGS